METILIVYSGPLPELIDVAGRGYVIIRDVPIALPADIAEPLLKTRPGEFERVKE